MPRPRRRWRSVVAVGALALLGLVACGGGGSGSTGSRAAPNSAVPDVTVRDLASGGEFALASVVPSDRPVLLWFWTPH